MFKDDSVLQKLKECRSDDAVFAVVVHAVADIGDCQFAHPDIGLLVQRFKLLTIEPLTDQLPVPLFAFSGTVRTKQDSGPCHRWSHGRDRGPCGNNTWGRDDAWNST